MSNDQVVGLQIVVNGGEVSVHVEEVQAMREYLDVGQDGDPEPGSPPPSLAGKVEVGSYVEGNTGVIKLGPCPFERELRELRGLVDDYTAALDETKRAQNEAAKAVMAGKMVDAAALARHQQRLGDSIRRLQASARRAAAGTN